VKNGIVTMRGPPRAAHQASRPLLLWSAGNMGPGQKVEIVPLRSGRARWRARIDMTQSALPALEALAALLTLLMILEALALLSAPPSPTPSAENAQRSTKRPTSICGDGGGRRVPGVGWRVGEGWRVWCREWSRVYMRRGCGAGGSEGGRCKGSSGAGCGLGVHVSTRMGARARAGARVRARTRVEVRARAWVGARGEGASRSREGTHLAQRAHHGDGDDLQAALAALLAHELEELGARRAGRAVRRDEEGPLRAHVHLCREATLRRGPRSELAVEWDVLA